MRSSLTDWATGADPHEAVALAVLRELFGDAFAQEFSVELWTGRRVQAARNERFVFCVNAPGALRAAFAPPIDLSAGRAFVAGLIDIQGEVEFAVDALMRVGNNTDVLKGLRLLGLLRRLPKTSLPPLREANLRGSVHSRARDRAAIGFHYDVPISFYRAFLDRELVYSCAYFDDAADDLDAAQQAKLDYILRKVRIKPGERLLDIGCGWGALVIRAAERFGAIATGITLSTSQFEEARRRIQNSGAASRAKVELRDYRDLSGETFDKIVSVGMFEHVGRTKLAEYFGSAYKALRPGGLFLNHGIANQLGDRKTGKVWGFMEKFIFPDGELVSIADALGFAEDIGFEVRDVENLREHYMRTVRSWLSNLEHNVESASAAAGDHAARAWRLYLAGSAQGFRSGRLGLFQSLLARMDPAGAVELPATRRDLYA